MVAAVIHPFGAARDVVPAGFSLVKEIRGMESEIASAFEGGDLVLVRAGAVFGAEGEIVVGVFGPPAVEPGSAKG